MVFRYVLPKYCCGSQFFIDLDKYHHRSVYKFSECFTFRSGPNKLKSVKNEKKLPISNDNLMSNRSGTKEHPPKRTVDEIIASLRDGSIQKG